MSETDSSWKKFLHPDTLKGNLISSALFISAFEMFNEAVIEKPKAFFSDGFDQNGLILGDEYKKEVSSKSKSPIYASLFWFKEMEAIDDEDICRFENIKRHRNQLAHELLSFVTDPERNLDNTPFTELVSLLTKIEKWWFVNFEFGIDPDMLPDGADPNDVIPGPIWSLQLMYDIALGNEPEEGFYYKSFVEGTRNK
jgi:hypothetical protein